MAKKIRVLNLYAGIGGNRKLWPDEQVEVTAIELDQKIADVYKENFPNDKVIVTDAHDFLLKHFQEFDFIWSSPPCQSHSRTNHFLFGQGVRRYPDMDLYEEILFLKFWFKGKWVVENVKPYYEPLIEAKEIGRHLFWSNFSIANKNFPIEVGTFNRNANTISQELAKIRPRKNITYGKNHCPDQVLRNCVSPEIGLHVFNCAFKLKQMNLSNFKSTET